MIKIKKGLDIPITGAPDQNVNSGNNVKTVALIADDYIGMKPTMLVQIGDKVLKGQPLFEDKKNPGVIFTSPVEGKVLEINRGDKRAFKSIVISNEGQSQVSFKNFLKKTVENYSPDQVKALILESGFWTTLRTRPFSKSPAISGSPNSIFVNVMDTQPLAANPDVVVSGNVASFEVGLKALAQLAPKVFVITSSQSKLNFKGIPKVTQKSFSGPHPAGNVGTHIHFLDPVSASKTVWHIGYQDVIAIGKLFEAGEYYNEKVVALCGPAIRSPRLVTTIRGTSLSDLTEAESWETENIRVISGSILGGRTAKGFENYLGAFHNQVTLIKEGNHKEFLGWHSPGFDKFSLKNIFVSKLFCNKKFAFNTNTNGSVRSIVPIGSFEAVMPMDILPTQLLRFMMAHNTDYAVNLGALELDEEDLALCTYVDPCKNEYGPVLRQNLNMIEKEG